MNFRITRFYHLSKEMTRVDGFSRLPNKKTREEINLAIRVDFVQFYMEKLTEIHQATNADPTLCELREMILNLRPYWSYRDELAIKNGILLKSG